MSRGSNLSAARVERERGGEGGREGETDRQTDGQEDREA